MTSHSYLRFPHPHADMVTFVAEDDVWLAPASGGLASRLSTDHVPVSHPRISPDGSWIAWTSEREGEPEVFVAPVEGGPARRLTYWGEPTTQVRGWWSADEVLVVSSTGEPSTSVRWAHAVPLHGGEPRRLPYGTVSDVVRHGESVLLCSVYSTEPAWWKRYRGGTTGKLWLDATGDGEFVRILTELDGHIVTPMWIGDRIAFLSDHEGVGALYSSLPDGTDLRRHGDHGPFYARNAASDGSRIAYHCAGDIWLLDDLDGDEPRRLDIRLGGTRPAHAPLTVNCADELGDVSPDHTGRVSVIEVRGTVHWLTHRDGPARVLLEQPGVRGRMPRVLAREGAASVAWIDDADGEEALVVAPVDGAATERARIASGRLGHVLELMTAPDGKTVALATQDNRLMVVDTATGEQRVVTTSEHGPVESMSFSPDSRWLAWSQPASYGDTSSLHQIRLANLTDLGITDVTPPRFIDTEPVFTLDGKYLAFLSNRTLDPIYDTHVFDLGFPASTRPYLVPLAAGTPSPFDPQLGGRPVEEKKSDDDDHDDDSPPTTVVDVEGIASRVVPVPVEVGNYDQLNAAKDALLWLDRPIYGVLGAGKATLDSATPRPSLCRYDLVRRELVELVDELDDACVSGDGNRIVVRDGGSLRVIPSDHKVNNGEDKSVVTRIDLDRVRVSADQVAEWRQSYREAWRVMRERYWRPDMDGLDWEGIRERYEPLLDRLGSQDDFVDLLWELQGELITSHCYAFGPGVPGTEARWQGLLGADLRRDENGRWCVARVLAGESSDPLARSPLAAPGVVVRAGDAIVAVDGREVDAERGPFPLLAGKANKPTELTVLANGATHRVVVVPIRDETPLRYHEWVASRRAFVAEASEGRIGYLHVPDMMAPGWAEFHRDLITAMSHEAVVADMRDNRGGHTSQLVLEKLARRVIGWDVARGAGTHSYPEDAPRGPVVAVINEHTGSDGDIICEAIRELGIGPVVGERSWGGIIGHRGPYRLVNGVSVTQPQLAFYFQGAGWDVENHGVDPDIEVVMTPQDWVADRDPQLAAAVRIALERLEEHPAAAPPQLPPPRNPRG